MGLPEAALSLLGFWLSPGRAPCWGRSRSRKPSIRPFPAETRASGKHRNHLRTFYWNISPSSGTGLKAEGREGLCEYNLCGNERPERGFRSSGSVTRTSAPSAAALPRGFLGVWSPPGILTV